jgi:hypothetical protein
MQVPEPVRYWNKDTQFVSGMLLYRTEMSDVGGISLDADAQLCNYVL